MHTGPKDVNADFMSPRRSNIDLLNFEGLACAPADSRFAFNGLPDSASHDDWRGGRWERDNGFLGFLPLLWLEICGQLFAVHGKNGGCPPVADR